MKICILTHKLKNDITATGINICMRNHPTQLDKFKEPTGKEVYLVVDQS